MYAFTDVNTFTVTYALKIRNFVNYIFLVSGSSDYSVRAWRLSGEYIGTLGSFVPWSLTPTRFPPDVQKIASFTTFKVLHIVIHPIHHQNM